MTRSSSPTASSSTVSDRSPPPLNAHHPPTKTMLPPSTTSFSPIPTSARPRRPLSPTSLRDVDIPLDPERAFAARGKFPAPPTGHELMALFPPSPPPHPLCPTSAFFDREERKFFAQAGKEIVRLRLEVDTLGARGPPPGSVGSMSMPPPPVPVPGPSSSVSPRDRHSRAQSQPQHQHQHGHSSHSHQHPRPHQHQHQHAHPGSPHHDRPPPTSHGAPQGPPLTTSPRVHVPPASFAPPPAPSTSGPAHPGYPVSRPPEHTGGGGEAMVVEDDDNDESWRRPTPHNARRRAGKHTRRVIVK
ncbi:hypothetical protein K466DRAFT_573234 [Polyporus arcularius HHB13444]|uniref:Uncharacterized protein n=1 Tax=Polyporus arcularius HHB13444 TaxID=1314778 RepID=A0A5C3PSJ4_9APHY|nr:hypothetical protein K466DRAFT_573234 [Polyporus arcularius HHB13444]